MKYSKEWFSELEIETLWQTPGISSRDLLLMRVCYFGAFRVSEALNSKWEDYRREDDYTYLLMRDQKTDKTNWETQPIPPHIYGEIDRYCKDKKIKTQDNVFQSNRSPQLSYPMAYKIVKKSVKMAGIKKPITTHSFRRSRATHLLNNGMALEDVSGILRHNDLETTMKYLKISKKGLFNKMEKIDKKILFKKLKNLNSIPD